MRHPGTALRRVQYLADRENESVEIGAFHRELLAAGCREGVIPGTAVVFGGAPSGFRPTFEEKALKGWVERAFADL